VDALLEVLESRMAAGLPLGLEECLSRLSAPEDDVASRVELIYHAYCLEESAGQGPVVAEYLRRFVEVAEPLGRVLRLHEALDATLLADLAVEPTLPGPGDEVGPYRLIRLLGQGTFARVFLAEQMDLDDRLVVVKLSSRRDQEPHLLARVEHPHVMGVLRQAVVADESLAILCMPFVGGATLSDVLSAHRAAAGRRWRLGGRGWLKVLDDVSAPERGSVDTRSAVRERLEGLGHVELVAWMGARLAEALEHAHRRGVVHGDVKPSNILLAADGKPLLFDFNLAAASGSADVGGTLAYMPPERLQRIAEDAGSHDGLLPTTPRERVRGDLYALGLVLAEWAGGCGLEKSETSPGGGASPSPSPARSSRAMRATARELAMRRSGREGAGWVAGRLRGVPRRLRPVLARCLAPEADDRYTSAQHLADDLDALARMATEPGGRRIGLRGWRVAAVAAGLLGLMGAGAWWASQRGAERMRVEATREQIDRLWSGEVAGVYQHLPINRPDSGFESRSPHLIGALLTQGDALRREMDEAEDSGSGRHLDAVQRQDLELWYTEQAWRHDLAVHEGGADGADRTLRFDPSRLGLREPAGRLGSDDAMGVWKQVYLEGLEAERGGDFERARSRYAQILRETPRSFWANYRTAVVATRLGEIRTAVRHLDFCLAQEPTSAELRVALAGLLHHLGRDDRALAELERVRPTRELSEQVALNLLFVQDGLGQTSAAKATLERLRSGQKVAGDAWIARLLARQLGPSDQPLRLTDLSAADRLRLKGAAVDNLDARLMLACCYRDCNDVRTALALIDSILEENPHHLDAQYVKGLLLHWIGEREKADAVLGPLIEQPRYGDLVLANGDGGYALHVARLLAGDALVQGHPGEAARWLDVGEARVRWLESLEIPGRDQMLRGVRAGYAYSRARVLASQRDANGTVDEAGVRRQLEIASDLLPGMVSGWLAQDPVLASYGRRPAPAH
jgi:serine/threonine protein kinase/tetratricopeptide (TPR) repeat protein